MATGNVRYLIKNLQAKANKEIAKGIKVFFSASVVNDNKSVKVLDNEPYEGLTKQLNNIVKTEKPEILKVDLITGEGRWIEGAICDFHQDKINSMPQNFQGFGEAEINALVEKKFEEKKKEDDFKDMKSIIKELADENDELKIRVTELEAHNEELEESLEKKNQVKYYAGMVGDVLESLGIKKERFSRPLAELMGLNDKDEPKKLSVKNDNSGIVEDNDMPENTTQNNSGKDNETTRQELISLISDFLNVLSNQTLGEVYTIFSEIEGDRSLAPNIIEFIAKQKEFSS
jgi:hypothetical protein